ncbi:response regulator [Geothrix sp. 21YS21S-2]|uniref:response regulator n=1 Tax=Geothrix sp. 21YS21S-2 TaxID=3068893 RepID=UPI0027BB1CCF|nr:response regulator [Geothrix sp. 21YS21S-2]
MSCPSKGRILVVDDEPLIREMAREILENSGYTVSEAVDGQAGLDLFLESPGGFDLVILDLVMPRLHGFQVMDRILQAAPKTRILISSGFSPDTRPELTRATPTTAFLAKPYRSKDLLEQVRRLLAAEG